MVAGDHECGGLTIGFAGTKYASSYDSAAGPEDILRAVRKKRSGRIQDNQGRRGNYQFADVKPMIEEYFGLKFEGDPKTGSFLQKHEISQIEDAFARSMQGDEFSPRTP